MTKPNEFQDKKLLIAKADEWAEGTWDESELEESERTQFGLLNLAKSSGSLGYSRGYEAARDKILELARENAAYHPFRRTGAEGQLMNPARDMMISIAKLEELLGVK